MTVNWDSFVGDFRGFLGFCSSSVWTEFNGSEIGSVSFLKPKHRSQAHKYYRTNSMKHSLSSEANRSSAVPVVLAYFGTLSFITASKAPAILFLSWARPFQSMPSHPTSWGSILILPFYLRLGLPSGILPSGLTTKILYAPLISIISVSCPTHPIPLDLNSTW